MSKDIRSFFTVLSKKSSSNSNKLSAPVKKPTQVVVLSSDDEDIIPETPQKKKEIVIKKRKKRVLSSDSEDEKDFIATKIKKVDTSKPLLKPSNAQDAFGCAPVKQEKVPERPKPVPVEQKVEKKKRSKKKSKGRLENEKFEDENFGKTLLDLDDDFLSENMDKLDESIKEAQNDLKVTKDDVNKLSVTPKKLVVKDDPRACTDKKETFSFKNNTKGSGDANKNKDQASDNATTQTPKRKAETYDPDDDINRHEKKRQSAILYQKYLNRSGPAHHGSKEIPKGKPDCLKNLCFIRTGVLDSLDNDEFDTLIKNHGGRIVHSVSKKVNYLVAGVDPGPAKLEKAKDYGITILSEDDVFDLIKTKSGLKTEDSENNSNAQPESKINDTQTTKSKKIKSDVKPPNVDNIVDKSNGECKKEKPSTVDNKINKSNGINNSVSDHRNNKHKGATKTQSNLSRPTSESNHQRQQKQDDKTNHFVPWTEKYKPTNVKSIIGQQGDKSNMSRLMAWLESWFKNHGSKEKSKLSRPNPWAKNDDGSYFKAALLSGPPGIGKTTTAHLVAKELGFDVVEFNASDTRSKRLLQEELKQLLSCKSIAGFFMDGASPTRKHVLLMDEVDGMAGNEDRGGVQELINLIKSTSIPVICMCNDRNHPKMRSLVNYCFDLRFSKPRLEQIKGAMMSVCFKEGIQISPNALNEIIVAAGMDMRQVLTNLSLWSVGDSTLNDETTIKEANVAVKDVPMGQWEVCHKVFSEAEHKKMSITERARLFYHDYSLAPLFVHENYLKASPHAPKDEILKRFAAASEAISMGDLIDKQIRSTNNWSLLDVQAMCASVIPGSYLQGHLTGQIDFPSWLGKNSKTNKFTRLVSEIQAHMRTSMSGSRSAVNLDYVTHLRNSITRPLIEKGTDGVGAALEVMRSYNLLREDLDSINELAQWPKLKDPMNMIETKVKTAFTKAYNKSAILPYSTQTVGIKKKASTKQSDELGLDNDEEQEEDVDSNPEDDDNISNDAMIKAKKPSKSTKKETQPKPSTSKRAVATGSGKGRKKK